jgi:hypothetical protein
VRYGDGRCAKERKSVAGWWFRFIYDVEARPSLQWGKTLRHMRVREKQGSRFKALCDIEQGGSAEWLACIQKTCPSAPSHSPSYQQQLAGSLLPNRKLAPH